VEGLWPRWVLQGRGEPKVLQGVRRALEKKTAQRPERSPASSVCLTVSVSLSLSLSLSLFMAIETKGRAWKPATRAPRGGFPFGRLARLDAVKAASHCTSAANRPAIRWRSTSLRFVPQSTGLSLWPAQRSSATALLPSRSKHGCRPQSFCAPMRCSRASTSPAGRGLSPQRSRGYSRHHLPLSQYRNGIATMRPAPIVEFCWRTNSATRAGNRCPVGGHSCNEGMIPRFHRKVVWAE
jgi:hypothetical protein